MYTFESRIRYSECDSEGNLTLESLLDYFQDCSTFHSEDLGIGTAYLGREHRAWVINHWQIVFDRVPRIGDRVIVGTFAYDMKGFLGSRNFVLDTPGGERLAYANSLWAYIDTDTAHPTKVPAEMTALYGQEPKLEMDYAPRKIPTPEGGEKQEKIEVQQHHLDTNHHVNNGQYIRMAMNDLPEGCRVGELRAEFKKPALLGDIIYPVVWRESDHMTVSLQNEKEQPYVNIQFFYRK